MEKFNNTTLFTGYLKQLLASFNLPKYKIYTKADAKYKEEHGAESPTILETITAKHNNTNISYPDNLHYISYIKEDRIQQFIDGTWVEKGKKEYLKNRTVNYFLYNTPILNFTKTLQIKNNSYDSYTHEYLGDYLRFKRDYNNINLMPLYNCFSNRRCDALKIDILDSELNTKVTFDTNDTAYKIYMLPVKLFQQYTIAIDCDSPVEICCGLYGAYQDLRDKFKNIAGLTYQKLNSCLFSQPILYTKLMQFTEIKNKNLLVELAQNECDLKLFIKVPETNTSSIVVLEGNYLNWGDCISKNNAKTFTNTSVINFENLPEDAAIELKTPLQLLRFNTGEQHPFADRLIEYLIGNVITSEDEIADNIKRVQKVIKLNTLKNDTDIQNAIPYHYHPLVDGAWDNQINYNIYEYINKNNNTFDVNHDILGFIDKDAEKYYQYNDKIKNNISISSASLLEEDK